VDLAFFRPLPDHASPDAIEPLGLARSSWSDQQAHGVAVAGALGRAAEHAVRRLRDDVVPARVTVDLFAPTRMEPCWTTVEVVRESSRLVLVDVTMHQASGPTARASSLWLRPSQDAPGETWSNPDLPAPPPLEVAPVTDVPHVPFIHSGAGWSQDFREHQDGERKTYWNTAPQIVLGEPCTPFQAVAASADGTSLAANWGSAGVQHINADVTLTLSRLPIGVTVGLRTLDRVEHDGVAVSTCTVFDRHGPLGTTIVTSMANTRRAIDMGGKRWEDDPRSEPGV
jgi:hypothetical protein